MTIAQIIEVLPLQVYVRRGELVIHFSSPADLVARLAETSAAIAELDTTRADSKPDRAGRRSRPGSNGRSDAEPDAAGSEDQPRLTS